MREREIETARKRRPRHSPTTLGLAIAIRRPACTPFGAPRVPDAFC